MQKLFCYDLNIFMLSIIITKYIFRFIKKVGLNLEIPGGTRIIDATGKLVIPGKIFVFKI